MKINEGTTSLMTIIPQDGQQLDPRAEYTKGLRALADVLDAHPELALPYEGHPGFAQSIFIHGPKGTAQALLYIQAMDERPTLELNRQSKNLTWLDIKGHISGLHIEVHLRANDVCEVRVSDVYRASDGSAHELKEWVIPAELLAAVIAEQAAPVAS